MTTHLHLLKQAFKHALQKGWKPLEAPWLPEGTTWSFVGVLDDERTLFVHCTTHKRFHTITSPIEPNEKYIKYFLSQPGFANALGYTLSNFAAWCDAGKDPVLFLAQCIKGNYGQPITA